MSFLQPVVVEVEALFVIQREAGVQLVVDVRQQEVMVMMAGVATESCVAPLERRGLGFVAHLGDGKPGDERAVEATAAVVHRLAVPGVRQVDLKADGLCFGVD